MTVNRSLDLAKARSRIGETEESSVPLEVHSTFQKTLDDSQSRVRELELTLVLEESKVSDAVESLKRLREESDERVRLAQESEARVKLELERTRIRADAAEAKVKTAEAKVAASEKELAEMALDAVYLVLSYNMSVDLSFLADPSIHARFKTRLAAEESAKAQAQLAVSESRVPKADPVVVMEAEVPPETLETPQA